MIKSGTDAKLMRIFISSTDKFKRAPLYEVIVYAARRYGLAGATVLKGIMGFGASSHVSSVKFFELTEKLPLIIEIADESEKIEKFAEIVLPYFDKIRYGCMIMVETTSIILYKKGAKKG